MDGKDVKYSNVNNGLILFDIPKGKHIIELQYSSVGIKIGMVISIISLSILILLYKKKI